MIASIVSQGGGPVTIFQSGTFTTLAQALRIDPGLKDSLAAVYFMGGAVNVPGNITNLLPDANNKVAEWNIYADPQAAKEVFQSGLKLYMVPLDATNQVIHSLEEILPWHQGGMKADLVASLYEAMFNEFGFKTVEIFDLTAAAIMVRPGLCEFQPLYLEVTTGAGDTSGQTVVVPDREPNVQACLAPDVERLKQAREDSFSP